MASPPQARPVARPYPRRPEKPGPFLLLDHAPPDAIQALDELARRWEALEAARRRRLVLVPPVLLALAAACPLLDARVGFGRALYTSFAPFLLGGAGVAVAALAPPGRTSGRGRAGYALRANAPLMLAVGFFATFLGFIAYFFESFSFWMAGTGAVLLSYGQTLLVMALMRRDLVRRGLRRWRRQARGWWSPPAWRPPLRAVREVLEAAQDSATHVRGWIDLTGVEQAPKLVAESSQEMARTMRYHDRWCQLAITGRWDRVTVRGVEDRLVEQGRPTGPAVRGARDWQPHRVRRRRRLLVSQVGRGPRGPRDQKAQAARLQGRRFGSLRVLRARGRGARLVLLLRSGPRGRGWQDLRGLLDRLAARPEPG